MTSLDAPGSFLVPVITSRGQPATAFIGPITQDNLPKDWSCNWESIWSYTDFDTQAIIKMTEGKNLWGLMRYTLFSYDSEKQNNRADFLFIENIEAHPARQPTGNYAYREKKRPKAPSPFINPVGKWLIWYACNTALEYCEAEPVLGLAADLNAVAYYRDIIGMSMVNTGLKAIGGDDYAFSLDRNEAQDFCDLQSSAYGNPQAVISS